MTLAKVQGEKNEKAAVFTAAGLLMFILLICWGV